MTAGDLKHSLSLVPDNTPVIVEAKDGWRQWDGVISSIANLEGNTVVVIKVVNSD